MTRYFVFIGVTTGRSSIVRIFPRWRDVLELDSDVEIEGWDLPPNTPAHAYREAVSRLKAGDDYLGALITTHKINLFQASKDFFEGVDHYAALCGEVSCIAKRENKLLGWAKDPISAGMALTDILGTGYFGKTGGEVLCFGAGGSGVAISIHLLTRENPADRPSRIVITDRSGARLEHLRTLRAGIVTDCEMEYIRTEDSSDGDALVHRLAPGSLVINATGMGKDSPGSPVTDAVRFPEAGIAWELNYRGDLDFLRQAREQGEFCRVRVEDGWQYFIYGWTAVIEEVFQRSLSTYDLQKLAEAAAFARPPLSG